MERGRILFFLDNLQGGGIQRVNLTVANALANRGHAVDIAVCEASGPLMAQSPPDVELVELKATPSVMAYGYALTADAKLANSLRKHLRFTKKRFKTIGYLPDLARLLRSRRPGVLFTSNFQLNLVGVFARRLARTPVRLVCSQHNRHTFPPATNIRSAKMRTLAKTLHRAYGNVDALICVSGGVADDLAGFGRLDRKRMTTIHNPIVDRDLRTKGDEPVDHPWFQGADAPVILGAGRLEDVKDFPTLLRAFAIVRKQRPARLMILGEAHKPDQTDLRKQELMDLATQLGVAEDVALAGFVDNPHKYLAKASLFVLSSRHEGFGNVLVEAMAGGCAVVSTDCLSGPSEILENGRYGFLVPVGDPQSMANAMGATLDAPPDPAVLRARANDFSVETVVDAYERVLFPAPI